MTNLRSPGLTSIEVEDLCDREQIIPWDRCCICMDDILGNGAAMNVYGGTLIIGDIKRPVAFKEPRLTQVQRVRPLTLQAVYKELKKEINYMDRLKDHQNVVHFHGLTFENNQRERPVLVVELAKNTLEEYLRERSIAGRVPSWREKLEYCFQVAKGIHALHLERIIHGDIKGSNILVFENKGTVTLKISDFGFSSSLTSTTGRTGGSVAFTAPECLSLARGHPELEQCSFGDQRKDIYSFGLVVWQILRDGEYPFEGVEGPEIESRKMRDYELRELLGMLGPDTPPYFIQIIKDCTKFMPSDRVDFPILINKLSLLLTAQNQNEIFSFLKFVNYVEHLTLSSSSS